MNRKEYENRCFSPNWVEIDVSQIEESVQKEVQLTNNDVLHINKEERLESKRRKDLNTLLKELDEIKKNIEKVAEKQHRLANLMRFYTGEFAR